MMTTKVKMVQVVQIRVETTNPESGKITGYNTQFQKPKAAAKHWAFYVACAWAGRKGIRDYSLQEQYQAKLYRRSLPIFERALA